jgi:hypothetical protein
MNQETQGKIIQDLKESGFLYEMQATLRDHIYKSIRSQQSEPITGLKSPLPELETKNGIISVALVYDFLDKFDLKLSKQMILPEAMLKDQQDSIEELESYFGIKSYKNKPILFEIVERMFEEQDESNLIKEEIESDHSSDKKEDVLVESAGTSQGHDQSVNSLAMEEFDYVEPVKKSK